MENRGNASPDEQYDNVEMGNVGGANPLLRHRIEERTESASTSSFKKKKRASADDGTLVQQQPSMRNDGDESKQDDDEEEKSFRRTFDRVSNALLGEPLVGHRRFFYMLDPFKAEQFVRAPKMYEDINMAFAILYFAGLFAFTVYAVLAYQNQKPVEATILTDASNLPPIYVNITTACNQEHGCGGWNATAQPIIIKQTWNNPTAAACGSGAKTLVIPPGTPYDAYSVGMSSNNWCIVATRH
jgi:hypothetical protein